jgi:ADP-ribose pyrophosphatase
MTRSPPAPFARLSRDVLVENRWHRYCRDRYVQRDGSEGDYYYIDMPGSCGAIPLFDDGTTLLVKVKRYLLGCELWEFPIGGMQIGDDPRAVAARELEEEAGWRARDFHYLGKFAPYKGVSNEVCHFFLAQELVEVGQSLEASEAIEAHRLQLAAARERLLEQPLGDGQSISALVLLDRFLAQRRC